MVLQLCTWGKHMALRSRLLVARLLFLVFSCCLKATWRVSVELSTEVCYQYSSLSKAHRVEDVMRHFERGHVVWWREWDRREPASVSKLNDGLFVYRISSDSKRWGSAAADLHSHMTVWLVIELRHNITLWQQVMIGRQNVLSVAKPNVTRRIKDKKK